MSSSDFSIMSNTFPNPMYINTSMQDNSSSTNIIIIFLIFILLISCCVLCIIFEFNLTEMLSSSIGLCFSFIIFIFICFIIYYYFYGDYKSQNPNFHKEAFKNITKNMGTMMNDYTRNISNPELNRISDSVNQFGNRYLSNLNNRQMLYPQQMSNSQQILRPQQMLNPQMLNPQMLNPQMLNPQMSSPYYH